MKKRKNFKFKNKKIFAILIFIFGFMFLVGVCFLYTPWVQNSHWFKVYQTKKILKNLPVSHPLRRSYEAYLKCLQSNEEKCDYNGDFGNMPLPISNK